MRLGASDDAAADMGPLAHAGHAAGLERALDALRKRAAGADFECSVHRPTALPADSRLRGGNWFPPALVEGVPAAECREELFGPVACLLPFDDEAEMLRDANDVDGILQAYVFSRDDAALQRVGGALRTGLVQFNGVGPGFETVEGFEPPCSFWGGAGLGSDGPLDALVQFFCGYQVMGHNGRRGGDAGDRGDAGDEGEARAARGRSPSEADADAEVAAAIGGGEGAAGAADADADADAEERARPPARSQSAPGMLQEPAADGVVRPAGGGAASPPRLRQSLGGRASAPLRAIISVRHIRGRTRRARNWRAHYYNRLDIGLGPGPGPARRPRGAPGGARDPHPDAPTSEIRQPGPGQP
jgi:hypothetical protein